MKKIVDIYEKLRVDDIILRDAKFPIDGTFEEIIKFLKEEGFKEVTKTNGISISKVVNKERNKCFTYLKDDKCIWFADTSKEEISKDNPIFFIEKIGIYFSFSVYTPNKLIVRDDKKEFLEELNKRFGWQ